MKRKAPLSMMELMVMIAIFAMASALCLQAFVKSDRVSRRVEARDYAAVLCQSVAECVRHYDGDLSAALEKVSGAEVGQRDGFGWFVHYDENWELVTYTESEEGPLPVPSARSAYILRVLELDSGMQGLGKALVEVLDDSGNELESLFTLEISWQKEVTGHG